MTIASLIRAFFGPYAKADADLTDNWFPIKAALALLAFYALLHLVVGGIFHFVSGDISMLSLLAGSTD